MAKHEYHVFGERVTIFTPTDDIHTIELVHSVNVNGNDWEFIHEMPALPKDPGRHRLHEWGSPECEGNYCTIIASESLVSRYLTHGLLH